MTEAQVMVGIDLALRDPGIGEGEVEALALKLGARIGQDADARVPVAPRGKDHGVGRPVDGSVGVGGDVRRVSHARHLAHALHALEYERHVRGRAVVEVRGASSILSIAIIASGVRTTILLTPGRPGTTCMLMAGRDLAERVGQRLDRDPSGVLHRGRRGQDRSDGQHGRGEARFDLQARRESVEPAPHAATVEIVQAADDESVELTVDLKISVLQ